MVDCIFDIIDSDKSKRDVLERYLDVAFRNFYVTLQDIYKNVKKVYSKIEESAFRDIKSKEFIFDDIIEAKENKILRGELNAHFPFLNVIQNLFCENDKKEIIRKFWFFFKALKNNTEIINPYFVDNKCFIQKWIKSKDTSNNEVGILISAREENNISDKEIDSFIVNCSDEDGNFYCEDFIVFIHMFLEAYDVYYLLNESEIKSFFGYDARTNKYPSSIFDLLSIYNIVPNIFNIIDSDIKHRYIYFTYVEMAFHNFFITLQYIYKRVKGVYPIIKKDDFGEEDNIEFFFGKHKDDKKEEPRLKNVFSTPEEIENVNRLLNKHFPFVKVIEDVFGNNNKIDIIEKFWNFLKVLRNAIEHADTVTNTVFVDCKDYILKWIKSDVEEGRTTPPKGIVISALKEMKKKFLWSEEPMSISYFKNNCIAEDQSFTFKSFVVFISLFLEDEYVYNFLNNSELGWYFYYKESTGERNIVDFTNEDFEKLACILSVYAIKLPAVKYDTRFDEKHILGLDIINELQKCPSEIYDHLNYEDQNKFKTQSDKGVFSLEEKVLKRYQDRFANLVLRYIDLQQIFKDIRFQVSLGRYRYKFYDYQCIDTDDFDRVRILQKDLKSFGRLNDLEQKRKDEWSDDVRRITDLYNQANVDTAQTVPYITNQFASYNLDTNTPKIPLWWGDEDCVLPISKEDVHKGSKKMVKTITPKVFLSVYDLPAVMFLHFLGGDPEQIIKDNYNNYRRFFTDIYEGYLTSETFSKESLWEEYKIDFHDIPHKLQDYLIGKSVNLPQDDFEKKIIEKQKEILADLEWRIRQTEKDTAKLKKRTLADYLVRSIVMLINDKDKKPTSKNYYVLHLNLALYYSFDEIKRMFERSGIVNYHPFLKSVLEQHPQNIVAFYMLYLKSEINFLGNIDNCKYLKFYKYQEEKYAPKTGYYYRSLAEHYLSNGYVDLTNKIFDAAIRERICSKIGEKVCLEIQNRINADVYAKDSNGYFKYNVAFLINFYYYLKNLNRILIDSYNGYKDYQPFYDFKREYIIDKKRNAICKREKKNNEKAINRYRVQDKILFEMATKLLIDEDFDVPEMRLSNIMPNDNVFNKQTVDFKIKVSFKDGRTLTIIANNLKVKNYSLVYRTIFDRRLETLAKCIKEDVVVLEDLKTEFANYEIVAMKINELIFNANEIQRSMPFVKAIRNSIAHWSYPHKDSLKDKNGVVIYDSNLTNLYNQLLNMRLGEKIVGLYTELKSVLGV